MATESAAMGPAKWVDAAGIRTRYFEAGSGLPIVLLHGSHMGAPFEATSAPVFAPVFAWLRDGFRVIAIDRLGQGFTDNPPHEEDYTLEAGARHVAVALEALCREPCHLVGHEEGGFLAALLAVAHPERVASVTLVAANALTPGADRRNVVHAHPPSPFLSRHSLRWIYETASFSHRVVDEAWVDEAESVARSERNAQAVRTMQRDDIYLGRYVSTWMASRAALHRRFAESGMPCPTLVAWGLDDPIAPIENAKYLMEILATRQRDTEMRIFNSAGHYVFREHPAAFSRMVASFVSGYAGR